MSQWSASFQSIMDQLESESARVGEISEADKVYGLLHALILSWQYESGALVWVTTVPGTNLFGSQVVFVNNEVLQVLQWNFTEWESGAAPAGLFTEDEARHVKFHLAARSSLPMLAHLRKKTTPPSQPGLDYYLHFHHGLPHNTRVTIGVPA